jgi:hypothetical protein
MAPLTSNQVVLVPRRHRKSMASKAKWIAGLARRNVSYLIRLLFSVQSSKCGSFGELTQLAKVPVEQNIRHSAWNGCADLPIGDERCETRISTNKSPSGSLNAIWWGHHHWVSESKGHICFACRLVPNLACAVDRYGSVWWSFLGHALREHL